MDKEEAHIRKAEIAAAKIHAAEAAQRQTTGCSPSESIGFGGGIMGLRDVSDFRYSLNRRIEEAVGAAHSAEKLIELRGLLDRNPETARIMELMREMGV